MIMTFWSDITTKYCPPATDTKKVDQQPTPFSPAIVPLAAPVEPTKKKLDATGNVPLIADSGTQKVESGFSIEKYIKSDKEISAQNDGLAKEIPGWYVLRDNEARQEQLIKHLGKFKTDKEQLAEAERLIQKGVTQNDVELMAGTLGKLRDGVQVKSAVAMLDNTNLSGKVKLASDNAVARNTKYTHRNNQLKIELSVMRKCAKETQKIMAQESVHFDEHNQVGAAQIAIDTKDADVVDAYAQVAYETDKKHHAKIAGMLLNTNIEKVQTTVAQTEGKYSKESQIEIYQKLMKSQYQSVLNDAASNIHTLDKSNQLMAAQFTSDTGNVQAINAAQAQQDKYDASVQERIKENLASAEVAAKEKAAASSEAGEAKKSEEKETLAEKAEKVAANKSGNSEEVAKILKEATPEERKVLLAKLSPQARAKAVLSLYGKISTMEYLNALNELSTEEVSSDVAKQIAETMSENGNTKKLSLLDSRLQVACVQSGKFTDVNPQNLSIMARYYLNKQTEGKKDLGWGIV